jgi:hypothetical protein
MRPESNVCRAPRVIGRRRDCRPTCVGETAKLHHELHRSGSPCVVATKVGKSARPGVATHWRSARDPGASGRGGSRPGARPAALGSRLESLRRDFLRDSGGAGNPPRFHVRSPFPSVRPDRDSWNSRAETCLERAVRSVSAAAKSESVSIRSAPRYGSGLRPVRIALGNKLDALGLLVSGGSANWFHPGLR